MGVLVGTSLIVIIPEGVETLYSASQSSDTLVKRAASTSSPMEVFQANQRLHNGAAGDRGAFFMPGSDRLDPRVVPPPAPTRPGAGAILAHEVVKQDNGEALNGGKGNRRHDDSPHAWIGVALITGFILMYLIDKIPQYAGSLKVTSQPHHISVGDLGRGLQRDPSPSHGSEADEFLQGSRVSQGRSRSFATTTGLVIHAAADGIALGASSSASTTSELSFIIFLAIMVHKAPAAFGLTSVLLKQGLSKRTARAHLLLFSLAAPAGGILTWLFAHTLSARRTGMAQNTKWWTGMLLLFSAGTFLYVAMHTMQEVESSPEVRLDGYVSGFDEGRNIQSLPQKPLPQDLTAAILGMILPLVLQVGHAHSW